MLTPFRSVVGCLVVIWIVAVRPAYGQSLDSISLKPEHQACSFDEDCVVVQTKCFSRGCECGQAVNKAYEKMYAIKLADCRPKDGPMATCDFWCPAPFARCKQGACVMSEE